MRALLTALALTLLATVADANAFKAHYGHYYATKYGDDTGADIRTLCGKQGVTGINYRVRWGDVETADGVYDDTTLNAVFATIAAMAAPSDTIPNKNCRVWIFPEHKLFVGGPQIANGDVQPCPTWLRASDGTLGYAPNTDTTKSVTIASGAASVTNASPIVITTSAAHGLANGATVFIDNVAIASGVAAANGRWTIANVTTTTFSLVGSHGNGARVTSGTPSGWQGKVSSGPSFVYTCKIWDSLVLTKYKAFLKHLGDTYDSNANFEGYILEESALGLSNEWSQDPSSGGTYTGALWTNANIAILQYCAATAFPTSRCMGFYNQISGNQDGLFDISAAISAIPGNQACYSGPDLLPNSTSLYQNSNFTYQVMVRHVGCRANSAQNNSYLVPGYSMTDIFNFAVQGTFGTFPCGTGSPAGNACVPKTAVTKKDGLCVNSYIFWNDSTAQQAQADPVIQANPYGNQWYGQCSCGGAAP